MHAIVCHMLFLLASQLSSEPTSPVDNVPLQPAPMSIELNAPNNEPLLLRPRGSVIRSSPATPIDLPAAAPAQQFSEPARFIPPSSAAPLMADAASPAAVRQLPAQPTVARTSFNDGGLANGQELNRSAAQALLRLSLTPLDQERIEGRPTTLLSALERASDRGEQLAVVRAYWRLTARVAEFHWATKEAAFLEQLEQPQSQAEHLLLNAARSEAAARRQETRLAVTTAQYELAELQRLSSREGVPVPNDLPTVSSYRTNFQTIFANRTPSTQVARLAATIPIYYELLEARAVAATAAFETLQALQEGYAKRQIPLADLLKVFDRLNQQRQVFVTTVRDYNSAIAEYSFNVVSSNVTRQQIVSTLIRTSPQNRETAPVARGPARAAFHDSTLRQPATLSDDVSREMRQPPRFDPGTPTGHSFAPTPAGAAHLEIPAATQHVPQHAPSSRFSHTPSSPTPAHDWRPSGTRPESPANDPPRSARGIHLQDPAVEPQLADPNAPVASPVSPVPPTFDNQPAAPVDVAPTANPIPTNEPATAPPVQFNGLSG